MFRKVERLLCDPNAITDTCDNILINLNHIIGIYPNTHNTVKIVMSDNTEIISRVKIDHMITELNNVGWQRNVKHFNPGY